jgi:hypothetical protein
MVRSFRFGCRAPFAAALLLAAPYQAADQRDYEKYDEDPEQDPGTVHRHTGHAAESHGSSDEGNDEKYNGVLKKISH